MGEVAFSVDSVESERIAAMGQAHSI